MSAPRSPSAAVPSPRTAKKQAEDAGLERTPKILPPNPTQAAPVPLPIKMLLTGRHRGKTQAG